MFGSNVAFIEFDNDLRSEIYSPLKGLSSISAWISDFTDVRERCWTEGLESYEDLAATMPKKVTGESLGFGRAIRESGLAGQGRGMREMH